MKKRTDGTNRMITAFLALTIVFLSMSMSIYAWFSLSRPLDTPIQFTTGATEARLELYMGRVPSGKTEADRGETKCKFHEQAPAGTIGMTKPVPEKEGATTCTINLEDISFGVLDSLGEPDPENIIYLRLAVPENNGTNFHFAMSYSTTGEYIDVYEPAEGDRAYTEVTVPPEVWTADADCNGFLHFQYAISTTYYNLKGSTTTEGDVKHLPISQSGLEFHGDGHGDWIDFKTYTCANAATNKPANFFSPPEMENIDTTPNDNTTPAYYLYIKITPNAEAFAQAMDSFSSDSFVGFSLRAQFEIWGEESTEEEPTA